MKHWFFYKKRHYILVVILLIFFLSLPSLSIFFYSFSSAEKLQNLPIAILLEYLKQTFFLSLGVCFFSALLGITQALLVVFFDFKGKKFLEWALILPFLFPPYILAYLYTDFFEYAGIFQSFLRDLAIQSRLLVSTNKRYGGIFVLIRKAISKPHSKNFFPLKSKKTTSKA